MGEWVTTVMVEFVWNDDEYAFISCVPPPEIYPLRCRAKAISIATSVNWIANYIVSATFLDVAKALSTAHTDKSKHPDGAFWLYAGVAVVGWFWLYHNMPETKGKSLEEIEQIFGDDNDSFKWLSPASEGEDYYKSKTERQGGEDADDTLLKSAYE